MSYVTVIAVANPEAMNWPRPVTPDAALLAFGFSAVVGVFCGFYPARQTGGLDSIDALRSE